MRIYAAIGSATVAIFANVLFAQLSPVLDLGYLPGDQAVLPATNTQTEISVAAGPGTFLATWSDYRARSSGSQTIQGDGDIFGIRFDSAGNPLDSMPFLIAGGTGLQQRPKVAWNGENWLVLYQSQDPTPGYYDTFIRAVRVSPQGQVLDATPLSFPTVEFSPSTTGLTVAGQGGQWLVARCVYHSDGYGTFLAGQRISGSGQLIDAAPVVLNDWVYGQLQVIANAGEYLVVGPDWNNSATRKARRIGSNLQPLGGTFNLPSGTQSIAGNGAGEYYVTWIADFVNLVGSRMTGAGALVNPSGTMLVPSIQGTVSMTHDGTNWWLARGVANLAYTQRINAAGTLIDPVGVQLPITVTGNVNFLYDTQIVPRASGGVVFAWTDYRAALGSDANGFALPISADNVADAERCLTTGTRNQRNPSVCKGPGGSLAVAFVSEAANDDRVLVHLLDSDGTPITSEPIEVAQAPTIGVCGIAFNGQSFMVTWDQGAGGLTPVGISARQMNPDGSFGSPAFFVMPGMAPAIDALAGNFCIGGSRFGTYPQNIYLWANRIDGQSGAPLDGPTGTFLGGGYVSGLVRVRNDGSQWFVCSHSQWTHDSSQGDAIFAKVPQSGTPVQAANPTPFSGGTGDLDVAFSGSKYLFVWRQNTLANANNLVAGRIMNADGSFGASFTIAEATGRQLRPTVTWSGTEFVVAWDDQRNQDAFFDARTDVYAARVSETGTVLDPEGVTIVAGIDASCSPSIVHDNGVITVATTRFASAAPFDSYRIGLSRIGSPACAADFNNIDGVTTQDIFDYLNAWFAGDMRCDTDLSGDLSVADIFTFLNAWFAGC